MKVFYIFLGLCVLGLAGTSFYYTNIRSSDMHVVVATSTEPLATIYVYREYGEVSFKNKTQSSFVPVADTKILIANYSTIKTGDGRGYIMFPDNSIITLASSTEIEINYDSTKVSIMQLLGTTYHRVTALTNRNKYEIRTPNTRATIRGTKLAVTYNPVTKKTLVAVTEHSVEVTSIKEDGTINKAPVIIQEGSLVEIQSATTTTHNGTSTLTGDRVTVRLTEEVQDIKNFIEENRLVDTRYDATPLGERIGFIEKIITDLKKERESQDTESTPAQMPTQSTSQESRTATVPQVVKETTENSPSIPKKISESAQVTKETIPLPPRETTTSGTSASMPVAPKVVQPIILKKFEISEEYPTAEEQAFVNSFYTTYEKLFLVNDPVTYCKNLGSTSAQDMVSSLLFITNNAGYILPNQTSLTSFATRLVEACTDGSMNTKAPQLIIQFDVDYPY